MRFRVTALLLDFLLAQKGNRSVFLYRYFIFLSSVFTKKGPDERDEKIFWREIKVIEDLIEASNLGVVSFG